jgi:6-phosphogluconate dehydrogenase (decarboxylating)
MVDSAEIGLTGLAVMGQNLARNISSRGIPVVVHNRTAATTDAFLAGLRSDEPLTGASSLQGLVGRLRRPRKVIVVVKAVRRSTRSSNSLLPLLEPGDVVMDGGNSFYADTVRRQQHAAQHEVALLGVGISGGEEGRLRGPSIIPGGDREAYALVEPILTCAGFSGCRRRSWRTSSRSGIAATWSRSSSRSPASCSRRTIRSPGSRSSASSSTRQRRRARAGGPRKMPWNSACRRRR